MVEIDIEHLQVNRSPERSRFEIALGDQFAVIDYTIRDGHYILPHVGVPPAYGGRGIATRMTRQALDMIRAEGSGVWSAPMCPFVRAFVQRNPSYQDMIIDARSPSAAAG